MNFRKRRNSSTLEKEEGPGPNSFPRQKGGGKRIRLLSMIFLTFTYFLVEIIVGYMTGSVALVADSFHMLSDVISLVIAYIAVKMSPKKWSQNTFGWARAEVLGALVNAVFLVALCFSIVVESIERFIQIKEIEEPKLILIVGSVGLFINLIGLGLFHEHGHSHGGSGGHGHSHSHNHSHHNHNLSHAHAHSNNVVQETQRSPAVISPTINHQIHLVGWKFHEDTKINLDKSPTNVNVTHLSQPEADNISRVFDDSSTAANGDTNHHKPSSATQMNMHGVFLHVLADALGSVIVIISALVIWLTEWEYRMYIDPVLSLLMVILISCSVWPLLVESAMVLLQTVPTHIQIDELKNKLLAQVQGALEVHEFHIWQLAGNRVIASAHILCENETDYMGIGEQIKEFFHNEGIHSTTIQLEFAGGSDTDNNDADTDTKSDCFLTCPSDKNTDCATNSCCGVQKRKNASVGATNLSFLSENSSEPVNSIGRNVA